MRIGGRGDEREVRGDEEGGRNEQEQRFSEIRTRTTQRVARGQRRIGNVQLQDAGVDALEKKAEGEKNNEGERDLVIGGAPADG